MSLFDGLRWRASHYASPYRPVYRQPFASVRRAVNNRRALAAGVRVAYVYADPLNTGDYASHLGVRLMAGLPGVELFGGAALPRTLRTLERETARGRRWSAIFVGGGGLLQGCFEPLWDGLLRTDAPLIVFGVGVNALGVLRRPLSPALLRAIASRASAFHVRDHATASLIADCGAAPITVGICPAVNYLAARVRDPGPPGGDLLHVLHSCDFEAAGGSPSALQARLRSIADRSGLRFREIDHTTGLNAATLDAYRRAAIVVSSRLHGCVFGYALARPVIAIVCDCKTQAFIDTHAPWLPQVGASEAATALHADWLDEVMAGPVPRPSPPAMAANESRMGAILRELRLCA